MRNTKIVTFMCCVALCGLAPSAEELVHVVQKGETFYAISRKYGVPADAIMSFNGIDDPDRLKLGQKIRIPDVYHVEKGDTLYGIARKFGISFDDLLDANDLDKNAQIKAGSALYIPSPAKSPATAQTAKTVTSKDATPKAATPKTATAPAAVPEPAPGSDFLVKKPLADPRNYEKKNVDTSIIWPVSVRDIAYLSGKVYGVSITSSTGESVKTISSGKVLSVGPYRGFGQVVFMQSKTGYIYVYGGLDSVLLTAGQTLSFGEEIGTLGTDSLSGSPRLYFMVYNKDIPVDPAKAPRGY
jgi:lipoprotein YgeR